jgi:hypothetical protein
MSTPPGNTAAPSYRHRGRGRTRGSRQDTRTRPGSRPQLFLCECDAANETSVPGALIGMLDLGWHSAQTWSEWSGRGQRKEAVDGGEDNNSATGNRGWLHLCFHDSSHDPSAAPRDGEAARGASYSSPRDTPAA